MRTSFTFPSVAASLATGDLVAGDSLARVVRFSIRSHTSAAIQTAAQPISTGA